MFGSQGARNNALNVYNDQLGKPDYDSRQQSRSPSKLKSSLVDYYKQDKDIAVTCGNINKFNENNVFT